MGTGMNIELALMTAMLKSGDFSPLRKGDITKEHLATEEGKILYNFITTYRNETNGMASYPSLTVVRNRFKSSGMELPELDVSDTVATLAHETRLESFRSDLRQFATNAGQIADTSSDPFKDTVELLRQLRSATESVQRTEHASIAKDVERYAESYRNKEILSDGIPWPWETFNKAMRGMRPEEVYAFVGRPKSRKTFTALRPCTHAFKHFGSRVLILSPEMPVKQMFLRSLAHLCDLPYQEFKNSAMAQAEESRLYEFASQYARHQKSDDVTYHMQLQELYPDLADTALSPSFVIVQSTGRDTSWIEAQIELHQPHIVLIDSYYRHNAGGQKRNDMDWRAQAAIAQEMKDIAMRLKVALILTSQLNREAQKAVGDLSSLSFSDAVGANMDGIFRVVTGKQDGEDVSALFNYAQRDVKFNGAMIKNKPCWDYTDMGEIKSKKQVLALLHQEEEEESKEVQKLEKTRAREESAERYRGATKTRRSPLVHEVRRAKLTKPFIVPDAGSVYQAENEDLQAARALV
jgi:replicative DNA helicase